MGENMISISVDEFKALVKSEIKVEILKEMISSDDMMFLYKKDICAIFGWNFETK